jgi:hypothetical protein
MYEMTNYELCTYFSLKEGCEAGSLYISFKKDDKTYGQNLLKLLLSRKYYDQKVLCAFLETTTFHRTASSKEKGSFEIFSHSYFTQQGNSFGYWTIPSLEDVQKKLDEYHGLTPNYITLKAEIRVGPPSIIHFITQYVRFDCTGNINYGIKGMNPRFKWDHYSVKKIDKKRFGCFIPSYSMKKVSGKAIIKSAKSNGKRYFYYSNA